MTEEDVSRETLIAEAEIGDEAQKFLDTDLGKTLLGMAHQEVLAAQEALEVVDPSDTKKITALQNQAKAGRNFEEWLKELVNRGITALNVWQQQRNDEG